MLVLREADQISSLFYRNQTVFFLAVLALFSIIPALSMRLISIRLSPFPLHILYVLLMLILPFCRTWELPFLTAVAGILTGLLLAQEPFPLSQLGYGFFSAVILLFFTALFEVPLPLYELIPVAAIIQLAVCISLRISGRYSIILIILLGIFAGQTAWIKYTQDDRHPGSIQILLKNDLLEIYRHGECVDKIYADPKNGTLPSGDLLPYAATLSQLNTEEKEHPRKQFIITYLNLLSPDPENTVIVNPMFFIPGKTLPENTDLLIIAMPRPLLQNEHHIFSRDFLTQTASRCLSDDGIIMVRVPYGMSHESIQMPEDGQTALLRGLNDCWVVYRKSGGLDFSGSFIKKQEQFFPGVTDALSIVFPVLQERQCGCMDIPLKRQDMLQKYTFPEKIFFRVFGILIICYLAARYFINWHPLHKPSFRFFEMGLFFGLATVGTAAIISNVQLFPLMFLCACMLFPLMIGSEWYIFMIGIGICIFSGAVFPDTTGNTGFTAPGVLILCTVLFRRHRKKMQMPSLRQDAVNLLTIRFLTGFFTACIISVFYLLSI